MNHDRAGEGVPQAERSEDQANSPARKRVVFATFAFASAVCLLLLVGALAFHWMAAGALHQEIAGLQRSNREPLGALFGVIQSSWEFYASPGNEIVYGRFSEQLARLPDPFGPKARQVASSSEFFRKSQPRPAESRPDEASAHALSAALHELAEEGSAMADRHDAGVLAAVQHYQDRAMNLTVGGLALGLVVFLTGLLHVRRIETVNSRQYEELLGEREKLRMLSARLLAAQEQERRAVARELHDGIGQSLSVLAMDATRAGALAAGHEEPLRNVLTSIRQMADQLLQSVRDLALGLRPSMLDDLGLPAALDWLARETSRRSHVEVSLQVEGLDDALPERYSTCIYRVVQEGLTNAARHAAAQNIAVEVQRTGSRVRIEVRDDGSGFDPRRKQGLGLTGAAERLSGLGGALHIESRPGAGTRFVAELPVHEDEE